MPLGAFLCPPIHPPTVPPAISGSWNSCTHNTFTSTFIHTFRRGIPRSIDTGFGTRILPTKADCTCNALMEVLAESCRFSPRLTWQGRRQQVVAFNLSDNSHFRSQLHRGENVREYGGMYVLHPSLHCSNRHNVERCRGSDWLAVAVSLKANQTQQTTRIRCVSFTLKNQIHSHSTLARPATCSVLVLFCSKSAIMACRDLLIGT